jgi:hypothetical protein
MRSRQDNVFATFTLLAIVAPSLTGCLAYSDPQPAYAYDTRSTPRSSYDYDHSYWQNDANNRRMQERGAPRPSYDYGHRYWQHDPNDHQMGGEDPNY